MGKLPLWLWALAGALIGAGPLFSTWFWRLVSLVTGQYFTGTNTGWPLILLGVLLVVLLALTARLRGAWAGLIGFGLVPAALLYAGSVISPPVCPGPPHGIGTPGVYHCVYYGPPWYDSVFLRPGVGFLAIALIGALIPLAPRLMRAQRPGRDSNTPSPASTGHAP